VIGVTRLAEKLVLWRDVNGQLGCLVDKCPHRGVALSLGQVVDDCLQCPFHGFEFKSDGACSLIPANGRNSEPPRAMKAVSYPIQEEHGLIYIWWGEPRESYPPLPFFESITDDFVFSTIRDHWATHYSRAIENQLDVVHLPFIHRTTIGRGNRTLVNGPLTRVSSAYPGDNLLELWVYNETDRGQKPLKPSEIPEPTRHPFLQFRYPNLWQNWISDDLRILAAFVPIDNENTLMYLRYYHKVKTPVIRQITGWVGGIANLVIERQDRRVVISHQPQRPDLGIGEILIPGDAPIITYRKIRRELIDAAEAIAVKVAIQN
jgi:phenylpropionate dioxygenase-like ring-hydroxylating dioxygenase large terminal subunit